jgi:streptomycin 6-kinase
VIEFAKNVIAIWGDKGRRWLENLPHLTAALAQHWNLVDLKPMPKLTYNYVLSGFQQSTGTKIIVKISLDEQLEREVAALRIYNGHGAVRLLDYSAEHKALLLEFIDPGISLKSYFPDRDDEAVMHAVQVMRQLHAARIWQQEKFPTIANWLAALERPSAQNIPEHLLKKAQGLTETLLQTQDAPVLLHGDLHHDNILFSADRGWLAIDPKGVLGEPAYEVGAFIRNPVLELLHEQNPREIIKRRLNLFAEYLNVDRARLRSWSYVQTILAACWAIEDNGDPKIWIDIARMIDACSA